MSLAAMNWARQQRTGSASRKAVLMAVADYADENGLAWPSQARLAYDTELTDRTVRTALGDLVEAGLIIRRTKRNAMTGLREPDRLQLCMVENQRKDFPPDGNRKNLPVAQPPENDDQTTGNSFQNYRKMTAKSPEAVSDKPTIEPPLNRSEANASGRSAALPVMSIKDRCWSEGKANLVVCGMTEREAGNLIGVLLKRKKTHAAILAATEAAVDAGSGDPLRYVQGVLRADSEAAASAGRPEKSSAITRFRDRLEARHAAQRSRTDHRDDGSGPVIDHEGHERPHRALH